MIFTVYADKAEEVSKRLDKLAKKATRYNVPFSYTVSDEHPETVSLYVLYPALTSRCRRLYQSRQLTYRAHALGRLIGELLVYADVLLRRVDYQKASQGQNALILTRST